MERLFPVVVRPLLDRVSPSGVRYLGAEVPEVLRRWGGQVGVPVGPAGRIPGDVLVADARSDVAAAVADGAPPRLLVLHDVEHGLVGTPDRRAQAVASAAVDAMGAGARVHVLPGLGGLVVAARPETIERLGDAWDALSLNDSLRALVRAVETTAEPATEGDVTAARRVIERQDRELAELRASIRRHDALERQVERLEDELERLKGRRSVRAVLRAASYARPLFRLRRGQVSVRDLLGDRSVGPPRVGRPRLRPHHEFASTDTGRFYDLLRPIVEAAQPAFVDRWARSEEALRADHGWADGVEPPLVSVIMPTHNRAHLIREAIDSVTDQTYTNWELLVCDDDSQDDTADVVSGVADDRIVYLHLARGGAAAARNAGLARAEGEFIAYLDTDNVWHPRFLEQLVRGLVDNPGRHAAYAKYLDVVIDDTGPRVKRFDELPFDYERLTQKNFIDLNSVVHRRVLYDRYGGFNEDLVRQQDWDLVLKYTFLRDPLYIDRFLALYRRNPAWGQITDVHAGDASTQPLIEASVASYYRDGLPRRSGTTPAARLSVLSWDICRNHFSKAFNVAEAVAADDPSRVQLLGFRFFDEPIFPPYADAMPAFETHFLDGAPFPAFDDALARTVAHVRGDVVYAVKPRLPSLGVALLANYHLGTPVVVECNDLESVVTSPAAGQRARTVKLDEVDPADPRLRDPYGELWTSIMEGLVPQVPLRATHNHVLDRHFGGGAFYMRNPKDDAHFDPDRYDRDAVRAELGIGLDERVLLFGGMVRKHKGVFRFAELLDWLGPEWSLLVVGSRETPDQVRLRERVGDRLRIIEPVDRNAMARVNLAADAVVLWLDPDVPASHYQMPYKLTDALAMRVPVVANPIGELADLGADGYLRLVPYGDDAALAAALDDLYVDAAGTRRMVDAGRRLYLRQFSYGAVRETMDLIVDAALGARGPLPVAEAFADFFARFRAAQPDGRTLMGRSS